MSKTKLMCRIAMTGALCFVLTLVSVKLGNLHISFASLPIAVSALLFGPFEAAAAALIGELLSQMLTYGFTATTLLWLIPPCLRAIIIGLSARRCLTDSSRRLEDRPAMLFAVFLTAASVTTVSNTAVIWLDSILYGYYTFAYVFGDFIIRLATGLITAVGIGAVSMPLVRTLRRIPSFTR